MEIMLFDNGGKKGDKNMKDDVFWVEGEIYIPDERKMITNRAVMQLLDKCGIRRTEEIELDGRKIKVADKLYPDKEGIIRFNYSIFEKIERKTAEYDTNTCLLKTPDSGYTEFGVVMNMVMTLLVIISESKCRFMRGDSEVPLETYFLVAVPLATSSTKEKGEKTKRDPDSYYLLYKRFLRSNEDEFLEFWDDDDLVLSDRLADEIERWKEEFQEEDAETEITEGLLADTVHEMYEDWGCRLVDKVFVTEFLEHRDDPNYRKAFRLFRSFMDRDLAYFPELTRRQAVEWVLRTSRDRYDAVIMSAFQSLLVNHKKRMVLFGF